MRVPLGYFIQRTWKRGFVDGKTWCAWPHTIYPTHEKASRALDQARAYNKIDPAYEHDVREVWMNTEES
jgi:hypothetical protein